MNKVKNLGYERGLMMGVNREGYVNPPIRAFFSRNPSIRQNFCSNPKPQPHLETEVLRSQ